jgi:hypothetical protein
MSKYANGKYQILNEAKYIGKKIPTYRSSWEHTFMRFCDNNPAIIQWASEPFMVPYRNPFTGKNTIYVPDFLIVYMDRSDQKHAEVVEVKPRKEVSMENARSARDQAAAILNQAKWTAAKAWCAQQGLKFRIVTEEDIFSGVKKTR